MDQKLPKGSRITGEGRQDLTARLVERYSRGESIRSMAEDIGRSYGFVHGVLVEAGVSMRSRGGATRGAAAEARRAGLRES
ncbi:helix-turn-helix domain-containing protein [Actinotalea sp. C106]|uniref:helix-turn-helix domain-containing protein n=1 Tax=Actinotalea sp. C106 TaxID=2908644 RepID=UPI002028204F|nr:helix-turn-helix domain-containing protein [Actinotalea sp. C106]